MSINKILFKIDNDEKLVTGDNKNIIFNNNDFIKQIEPLYNKLVIVDVEGRKHDINGLDDLNSLKFVFFVLNGQQPDDEDHEYYILKYIYENKKYIQITNSNSASHFPYSIDLCKKYNDIMRENNLPVPVVTEQTGGTTYNIVEPNEEFKRLLMNNKLDNVQQLVKYANAYLVENGKNMIDILIQQNENDNDNDNDSDNGCDENLKFLKKFKEVFLELNN